MLNGEREDEAPKDERNHIVHVGMRHVVGGGDPEEGEEEERRHGGYRHWHRLRHPPREHPHQHRQHVPPADVI